MVQQEIALEEGLGPEGALDRPTENKSADKGIKAALQIQRAQALALEVAQHRALVEANPPEGQQL